MAEQHVDYALLILSVVDLPFVQITTYEEKRGKPWTGYAAVAHGTRHRYQNWCHDVNEGTWAGQPLGAPNPWHRTEAEAWECFDRNHPGLREALAAAEQYDGYLESR